MKRGELSTKFYETALYELEQFLRRTPATARQIAEAFACSRVTAHKRLDELERRGVVRLRLVREGPCGPESYLYLIKSKEERRA